MDTNNNNKTVEMTTSGTNNNHHHDHRLPSSTPRKMTVWYNIRSYVKNNVEFKSLLVTQLLCGVYILIVTFSYAGALGVFGGARDPVTGTIVDPASPENTAEGIIQVTNFGRTFTRAVVASNDWEMVCLAVSRFSAFSMYPAIVCVFWSKYRALQAFFYTTPLGIFCVTDTHRLHVYCGWVILIHSTVHAIFHLIRWGVQDNLYLLFHHRSGITGFIVYLCTLVIVVPMTYIVKRCIHFEMRKYAHYLFWIFCITMSFHASVWALPTAGFCAIVFPTLIIIYGLDAFYVTTFMTEKIATVRYETLPSGVQLNMPVSDRFRSSHDFGGYGYIMFEWVDKYQWHAFSIYESDTTKQQQQQQQHTRNIFIARAGDWTNKVHSKMDRNTVRPVWIMGPFPSPYNNADQFDNLILVAAGIGITPALSTIEAYRSSRRINLIWTVRDASMLTFFLSNAKLDHKGFNLVFYTGKDPLPDTIENHNGHANLQIIRQRPVISYLVPNIIHYIDKHGYSQHEAMLALALIKEKALQLKEGAAIRMNDPSTAASQSGIPLEERVAELVQYAALLGLAIPDLEETNDQRSNNDITKERKSNNDSEIASFPLLDALSTSKKGDIRGIDEFRTSFMASGMIHPEWVGLLSDDPDIEGGGGGGGGSNKVDDSNDNNSNRSSGDGSFIYNPTAGTNTPSTRLDAIIDKIESSRDLEGIDMTAFTASFSEDTYHLHSVWNTNERPRHIDHHHHRSPDLRNISNIDLHQNHLIEEEGHEREDDSSMMMNMMEAVPMEGMMEAVPMEEKVDDTLGGNNNNNNKSSKGIWEENVESRPYVHAMSPYHLETWGLLYCGGRNPLLEALVNESKDLNIPLHEEAFDW
jgi:predicted ferric reductase